MDRMLALLRRLVHGDDVARARRAQGHLAVDRAEARAFARKLAVSPGPGIVVLARGDHRIGRCGWLGLAVDDFISRHGLVGGGTGTGKTILLICALIQVLLFRRPVLLFDGKGETSSLATDVVVPALAETEIGAELVQRLRVIRIFDRRYVPELNITKRQGDEPPAIQAETIATAIEESLGEGLGGRMRHLFLRTGSLAIELDRPLPEILGWLRNPAAFARAAGQSKDPFLREYVRTSFPRENRASIEAVAARLDAFLLTPGTREALSTRRCIDVGESLDTPCCLTILDPTNPPAGCERAQKFWSATLVGMAARAILNRRVSSETLPAWFVGEEIQEGLTAAHAALLSRTLATARFKRVGVTLSTQDRSRLMAVDPTLVHALRTNVTLQVQFRASPEDSAAFAHALPTPDGVKQPAQARQALIYSVTRLPRRAAYLWVRDLGRAQLVRAPRVDLDGLRERAGCVSEEMRERIRQGSVAVSREDLMAVAEPPPPISLPPLTEPLASVSDEFPGLG